MDTNYTLPKPQMSHFEDFVDYSEDLPCIPKTHPSRRRSLFNLGNTSAHPYQPEIDQLNLEGFKDQLGYA